MAEKLYSCAVHDTFLNPKLYDTFLNPKLWDPKPV